MKMSEAILKGMERFPVQAFGEWCDGKRSACAIGCANWANTGDAEQTDDRILRARQRFMHLFGYSIIEANDDGIPRDVIAGMLMAIGE